MTPLRWLLTALSFALALGASGWVVARSWPHEGGTLSLPWSVHAIAASIMLLEVAARAVKLVWSARALSYPLRFGTALRTCLGGDFVAAITPARSGSEPARFMILATAGVPASVTILLLFLELFLEALSLAVVASVLALVFHQGGGALGGLLALVGGYAAFVIGAAVLGSLLARRYGQGAPPAWARRLRLNATRWRAVQKGLRQMQHGMSGLRTARRGALAAALLASVVHVALRLVTLPAIVLPLAPGAPLAPLFLWPLALFYGSVVAPAPGGGGAVEFAFTTVLKGAIPAALMGRALVWWRVYTFYGYVVMGAVAAGRTALRALRGPEALDDENEERRRRVRWGRRSS